MDPLSAVYSRPEMCSVHCRAVLSARDAGSIE